MNPIRLKFGLFLLLLGVFSLTSCSNGDDNPTNRTRDEIISNATNGTWKITKFMDSDEDETNHFTGYNFTFNSSGVLSVSNGTNSYEGSWSITDSNSDDDDSFEDLDFNIFFNLTNDFEDLNDDWEILSYTSTKIELIDISGGNGETDYLTFEKN